MADSITKGHIAPRFNGEPPPPAPRGLPLAAEGRSRVTGPINGYRASTSRLADIWRLVAARNRVAEGLCVGLVVTICLPFWCVPLLRNSLPIGFAGLYAEMAKQIAASNFGLPASVPYYGGGEIPFAYPPLAMYVMAAAVYVLHVPLFVYLRLAPLAFVGVVTMATYLLARELMQSRTKAIIAAVLVGVSPDILYFELTAGGAVRALG